MCGIAGWLSSAGGVRADVLEAMSLRLAHRGPDGAGLWLDRRQRLGFAHRRLSIIDLSAAAAQPMRAESGAAVVTFNGELYNHRELRARLEECGRRFRTDHSDTEVLLHGALEWGIEGLLERLVGQFAFAYYDRERGVVTLVRDRLGVKPLYTARRGSHLLFASEAKALFAHPAVDARLDHESLGHHLTFRAVPAPRTLFEGVECLGPGELCEYELATGRETRRRYWDPLANAQAPPPTLARAQEQLAELLEDSLQARLEADVPVGLFLSGGVDSALLLEKLATHRAHPHTYTVGYPGHERYDESAEAARLAAERDARHTPVPLRAEDFTDAFARVAWHLDEPIAAPVCSSYYHLAQAARASGVPVVLSGEGADELFVGYRSWLRLRDLEHWNRRLPDLPGRLLRRGAAALGALALPWCAPEREVLRRAAAGQELFWGGALDFGEDAKRRVLGPAVGASGSDTYEAVVAPLRRDFLQHREASDHAGWMSYVDLRFRLPQLMLPRLDRLGLAFGVEGRVPYLDHRLVEFVSGLPSAWRGGVGHTPKALLKAVAVRDLPHAFVHREKRGFQAPVAEWKAGPLGTRYGELLGRFAERTGLFDRGALRQLLARPGERLYYGLAHFMLWHELYIERVLGDELPEAQAFLEQQGVAA